MIKLEELKQGDKVYKISGFEWCNLYEISKEKHPFEYQSIDDDITYVVEAENITQPFNHSKRLFRRDEKDLFLTQIEAIEQMNKFRKQEKSKLKKDNNLIDYLFEIAKNRLPEQHQELIAELITEEKEKNLYVVNYEYKVDDSIETDTLTIKGSNSQKVHQYMEKFRQTFIASGFELTKYSFEKVGDGNFVEV